MAREAHRSLYGDLTKLKDSSVLNIVNTNDDAELFQLLMAVSAWVDRYCDRHFYPRVQTLEFDGNDLATLQVPDLAVITSLKEDANEDLTFETTWAATDYWLAPYNAEPTQPWGQPYTTVKVRAKGTKAKFNKGEQRFEIAGRWGYREFREDSASNINQVGGISATATSVGTTAGADFAIGQTIIIESEQMLVTNIFTNALFITRGLNGTTAAAHADNLDVYILRWPLAIERATLINTARIWTRAPGFEPFYVGNDLDSDVAELLSSYRRIPV